MRKIANALLLTLSTCCLFSVYTSLADTNSIAEADAAEEVIIEEFEPAKLRMITDEAGYVTESRVILPVEKLATQDEIELIALVTMAEAEGESEEGKRLVIDTILNRVDSPYFPDTITEVIYQPNAFTSMWNGRVDRCYVMDDICQLVREELQYRTNYDVVFFTAGAYGKYGSPMFQVGNHYFASY